MLRLNAQRITCVLSLALIGVITAFAQSTQASVPSAVDPNKAIEAAQQALQQAQTALTAAQNAQKAAEDSAKAADKHATDAKSSQDAAAESEKNANDSKNAAAGSEQTSSASAQKTSADAQATAASASNSAAAANNAKKSAQAAIAAGGVALNGSTNVNDNIDVQVVLLPREQSERVFSKEIARHYAVVQVIIDNKSNDAAFVLHSIFVDYTKWALSGISLAQDQPCKKTDNAAQGIACPGEVASIESRVVRGELQDASVWSWRNGVIRAAVLVGAVATGIPAFGSKNAVKYVGVYTGQFVPGLEVFWPDGIVAQLNRVSDFGFQTNKLFAKGDSDLVYAFFPIERFLTPGMANIFLNAPAVYFAPAQIFVDGKIGRHCRKTSGVCLSQSDVDEMKNLLEDLAAGACPADVPANESICVPPKQPLDEKAKATNQKLRDEKMLSVLMFPCVPQAPPNASINPDTGSEATSRKYACTVQDIVNRVSLNSIVVRAQGIMTVDVQTVPGNITDITFDKGNNSPDTWTVPDPNTPAEQEATITGRYLTDAVPSVARIDGKDGKTLPVDDYVDSKSVSVANDQSTDTKLVFKLKFKKTIESGSTLHFTVTKYDPKDKNKVSPIKGNDFELPVSYTSKEKPGGADSTTPAPKKSDATPAPAANRTDAPKKK